MGALQQVFARALGGELSATAPPFADQATGLCGVKAISTKHWSELVRDAYIWLDCAPLPPRVLPYICVCVTKAPDCAS